MSTGVIIAIVITVVLLLGIGGVVAALVLTKKTPAKSTSSTPTPSTPTPSTPTTVNRPPIITIPTNVSSPAEGFTLKNGDYTLSMDGKNLVVKRNSDTVWSSGTFNDSNPSSAANSATVPGPYKISLQNDGNLVVYGANNFVWSAAATSQFYAPEPNIVTGPIKSHGPNNKCVDNSAGNSDDGNKIQLWDCDDNQPNQMFWMDRKNRIINTKTGKCLDVAEFSTSPGSKVHQWTCHDNDNQKWDYDDKNRFRPKHAPNMCLDYDRSDNGTQLIISNCGDQNTQKWSVPGRLTN